MKRIVILFFLLLTCLPSYAQATNNAIKMGYNFVTVSQTVVFNDTMRAGGTMTLTANVMDGGGRNPGDPFTMKLVFYNSSNAVLSTVQQAYTMVLGGALAPYTVTATNCGGSCSTVAYVSVQFYGKDGGYWAGNYGPYIQDPSLTFNGGSNILYNPEFGVYGTNGYAQGWTSSNGWQSCALYSGAQTCVVNNGATVNAGNYSATGGTTSGTSGGYTAAPTAPSLCCGGSSATFSADSTHTAKVVAFVSRNTADTKVAIEQIGSLNNITINQTGTVNNYVEYHGVGNNNTISVTQSATANTQTNFVDIKLGTTGSANNNTVNVVQQSTGGTKGAFVTINDSNNSLILQQKDAGNHYANVNLSGGNKNVDVTQQGSASHMANITLSGNPVDLSLTQSGSTQQFYSINHNCATTGGCAKITVTQGQ